jgi:ubiquinone/menaquinone biosynthesis C-methylase UbiE
MADNTLPVRREYDRLAADYDHRWRPYIDATLRTIIEALRLDGREKVLDVPCGTGELEQRLLAAWPDLEITGVDLSRAMLQRAIEKDAGSKVTWIAADVSRLPLPDDEFDVVVCANSFHYFRAAERSLQEIRRVLRPGGTFILVDWCDDYLTCKLCSLWLRWTDPAFHRTYSLRSCRSLLEDAGFQIEHAERFHINWLWGLMRLVCRRATSSSP